MSQIGSLARCAALVGAVALCACDGADKMTAPASRLSPNDGPKAAAFVDQSNTQDFPYTWSEANPCTHVPVTLTGNSHVITHAVLDGSLGAHLDMHVMARGSGIDAVGGQYSGSSDDRYQTEILDPTTVLNVDHRTLVHGPTRQDDFFVHTVFHVTVNGNGVPTAAVDKMYTRCDG